MKPVRLLLAACLMIAVTGCKLAVMVPPGGLVQSASGTRNCDGGLVGKFCTFDLSSAALPFNESFTVSARPGYQFVRWQKGKGFFCGKSTSPTCTLSIANNDVGAMTIALLETGYLMPVFKEIGIDTDGDGVLDPNDADDDNDGLEDGADNCPLFAPNADGFGCPKPLPNAIIVDGKEWAQPALFAGVSRNEVRLVCPLRGGVSVCTGELNDVDINGWNWATSAEVTALLGSYSSYGQDWCSKIGADFIFTPGTRYDDLFVIGWLSDTPNNFLLSGPSSMVPCFRDHTSAGQDFDLAITGGWFYRSRP